jgi:ABC-type multidrug transport system ATPase subunit
MDEVQALADRMIILVDGHIAAEGRPDELQALHATHAVIRFDTQGRQLPEAARRTQTGNQHRAWRREPYDLRSRTDAA